MATKSAAGKKLEGWQKLDEEDVLETCWRCLSRRAYGNNAIVFCDFCAYGTHQKCEGGALQHVLPGDDQEWICKHCRDKSSAARAQWRKVVAKAANGPFSIAEDPAIQWLSDDGPSSPYRAFVSSVLKRSADFLTIFAWFEVFSEQVGLEPLTFDQLESIWCHPTASTLLSEIHVRLLTCAGRRPTVSNWFRVLQDFMEDNDDAFADATRLAKELAVRAGQEQAQRAAAKAATGAGAGSSSSAGATAQEEAEAVSDGDDRDEETDARLAGAQERKALKRARDAYLAQFGVGPKGKAGRMLGQGGDEEGADDDDGGDWSYFHQPLLVRVALLRCLCDEVLSIDTKSNKKLADFVRVKFGTAAEASAGAEDQDLEGTAEGAAAGKGAGRGRGRGRGGKAAASAAAASTPIADDDALGLDGLREASKPVGRVPLYTSETLPVANPAVVLDRPPVPGYVSKVRAKVQGIGATDIPLTGLTPTAQELPLTGRVYHLPEYLAEAAVTLADRQAALASSGIAGAGSEAAGAGAGTAGSADVDMATASTMEGAGAGSSSSNPVVAAAIPAPGIAVGPTIPLDLLLSPRRRPQGLPAGASSATTVSGSFGTAVDQLSPLGAPAILGSSGSSSSSASAAPEAAGLGAGAVAARAVLVAVPRAVLGVEPLALPVRKSSPSSKGKDGAKSSTGNDNEDGDDDEDMGGQDKASRDDDDDDGEGEGQLSDLEDGNKEDSAAGKSCAADAEASQPKDGAAARAEVKEADVELAGQDGDDGEPEEPALPDLPAEAQDSRYAGYHFFMDKDGHFRLVRVRADLPFESVPRNLATRRMLVVRATAAIRQAIEDEATAAKRSEETKKVAEEAAARAAAIAVAAKADAEARRAADAEARRKAFFAASAANAAAGSAAATGSSGAAVPDAATSGRHASPATAGVKRPAEVMAAGSTTSTPGTTGAAAPGPSTAAASSTGANSSSSAAASGGIPKKAKVDPKAKTGPLPGQMSLLAMFKKPAPTASPAPATAAPASAAIAAPASSPAAADGAGSVAPVAELAASVADAAAADGAVAANGSSSGAVDTSTASAAQTTAAESSTGHWESAHAAEPASTAVPSTAASSSPADQPAAETQAPAVKADDEVMIVEEGASGTATGQAAPSAPEAAAAAAGAHTATAVAAAQPASNPTATAGPTSLKLVLKPSTGAKDRTVTAMAMGGIAVPKPAVLPTDPSLVYATVLRPTTNGSGVLANAIALPSNATAQTTSTAAVQADDPSTVQLPLTPSVPLVSTLACTLPELEAVVAELGMSRNLWDRHVARALEADALPKVRAVAKKAERAARKQKRMADELTGYNWDGSRRTRGAGASDESANAGIYAGRTRGARKNYNVDTELDRLCGL